MRCLVTAAKHVNNIRAIARQPPVTTIEGMLKRMFSVCSALELYNEDPRPAEVVSTPRGGEFEYLHRSLASRRRRRKGNPVPGVVTGLPCSWEL
jgi:hypothetical protein